MGIQILSSDPSQEFSQVILEFNFSCGFFVHLQVVAHPRNRGLLGVRSPPPSYFREAPDFIKRRNTLHTCVRIYNAVCIMH